MQRVQTAVFEMKYAENSAQAEMIEHQKLVRVPSSHWPRLTAVVEYLSDQILVYPNFRVDFDFRSTTQPSPKPTERDTCSLSAGIDMLLSRISVSYH